VMHTDHQPALVICGAGDTAVPCGIAQYADRLAAAGLACAAVTYRLDRLDSAYLARSMNIIGSAAVSDCVTPSSMS